MALRSASSFSMAASMYALRLFTKQNEKHAQRDWAVRRWCGEKSRESHRRESHFYVQSGRDAPCTYAAAMWLGTMQPSRHHSDGIPGRCSVHKANERQREKTHAYGCDSFKAVSFSRSVCVSFDFRFDRLDAMCAALFLSHLLNLFTKSHRLTVNGAQTLPRSPGSDGRLRFRRALSSRSSPSIACDNEPKSNRAQLDHPDEIIDCN